MARLKQLIKLYSDSFIRAINRKILIAVLSAKTHPDQLIFLIGKQYCHSNNGI